MLVNHLPLLIASFKTVGLARDLAHVSVPATAAAAITETIDIVDGSAWYEGALGVDGAIREYTLVDRHTTTDASRWLTQIGWPIFQTARAHATNR